MADLQASGVPIDGEAGVGYRIGSHVDLPPLMFSHAEIEALAIGARFVESWGGPGLAHAARSALAKIAAALPRDKRATLESSRLFAPGFFIDPAVGERVDELRAALAQRRMLELGYRDGDGRTTSRRLRPLGLYFWGGAWSLGAWCELRQDFRNFRLDRIDTLRVLDETSPDEAGKRLEDFVRAMESRE